MTVKAELLKSHLAFEASLREVVADLERLHARMKQIAAASHPAREKRKKISLFRCPGGGHLSGSDGRACKHCGMIHL
ncbi:hypothetical protein [Burkholderia seminalis]|uniref:Transposase n=1 Tax=Burkholderia seminalis TaxID=488731 RepID=A0A8A8D5I7_9BURK|nr:hypothetical protein [Burkholderia seminalis]QTO19909.1 hypothetical protein DT99_006650 [Burkholderia seminalis]